MNSYGKVLQQLNNETIETIDDLLLFSFCSFFLVLRLCVSFLLFEKYFPLLSAAL